MVSFHLPMDIITVILLKLPSKSILQFKSVCKTWYALIKSPHFIENHHLSKSNINSVLVTTTDRFYINIDGVYKPIGFGSVFSAQKVDFLLLGICSGLVCIAFYRPDFIILGNPTTREFKKISSFKLLDSEERNSFVFYGFSFFSGEYKLVRLVYCSVVRAEIYVMTTNSWEEINVKMDHALVRSPDNEFYRSSPFMPVVINGVFHWMASFFLLARVVSFDINKGLFYETSVSVLDTHRDDWSIIEYKEELSLLIYRDDRKFELWVLNEDKRNWSWKLRIEEIPRGAVPRGDWKYGIEVVSHAKNGELLVEDGYGENVNMEIFSYDMHSRKTKTLAQFENHAGNCYHFYTESLRSVKPKNGVVEADMTC